LKALKIPNLSEFLLFSLSPRCLPIATRFESGFVGDFPGVDDLMTFVKLRVATFEVKGASGFNLRIVKPNGKSRYSALTSSKLDHKCQSVLVSTKISETPLIPNASFTKAYT